VSTNQVTNDSKVVAIASIAAELHSVINIAWGVSLAAKNAKVISAQAGAAALGFQPVTNFIDEISQSAIHGVEEINHEALKLSRITVSEQRANDAHRRFSSVISRNKGAVNIGSLSFGMEQVEKNLHQAQSEYKKCLTNLVSMLESMDECMLSAHAIASVSRIVTSNISGYSDKLGTVADNLDEAASSIKEKVSQSYIHLRQL
jgi:hypothetical protein